MEFKKNFGFGAMRLPMNGEEVDLKHTKEMVDLFMANGFNYFDTAHMYIKGKSEIALRECLTKRYPRESYILTEKISGPFFEKEEDIDGYFENMLSWCGVEYFDFLLLHAQHRGNYDKYKKCKAYEKAMQYKKEGKVRHIGISFHDSPEFLDKILTENPCIEIVQLQFNYLDVDNPSVESMGCYQVARKHNKPIIVMEPVKGGTLANIPEEAQQVFKSLGDMSPASYALRYAAGFEGIVMVLSGMSNTSQMLDNISFMKDFKPLTKEETEAVFKVKSIINEQSKIPCTACRYCVDGCPKNILIPDIFEAYNTVKKGKKGKEKYLKAIENHGKADDCILCGKCENACPQFIDIRKFLKESADAMKLNAIIAGGIIHIQK